MHISRWPRRILHKLTAGVPPAFTDPSGTQFPEPFGGRTQPIHSTQIPYSAWRSPLDGQTIACTLISTGLAGELAQNSHLRLFGSPRRIPFAGGFNPAKTLTFTFWHRVMRT